MIKILCYFPQIADATSFYRGAGPFFELRKIDNIQVDTATSVNWFIVKNYDILFFQRPCEEAHIKSIQIAKQNNKKVWIDFDDLLLDVPQHNPVMANISKEKYIKSVTMCIEFADIITCTNSHLAEQIKKYNNNVVVIPNAFDDYLFPIARRETNKKIAKNILWRGSATHIEDLATQRECLISLSNKYKRWFWVFLGYCPSFFYKMNNAKFLKAIDIVNYFEMLNKMLGCLFICPLEDNSFNRSKSNILLIESAYSGSACLVPNWPEWSGLLYNNEKHFSELLEAVLSDNIPEITIKEIADKNWQYVTDNLLLSKINQKRVDIIKTLMDTK